MFGAQSLQASNLRAMTLATLPRQVLLLLSPWLLLSCVEPFPRTSPADAGTNEHCTAAAASSAQTETAPKKGFTLETCDQAARSWRRITDHRTGTVLELTEPPQRIVSQSLGSDEMLFALLPESEFDRLVAVSALAQSPDYSEFTEQAARVGQFVTDKTEQILALSPDLVFAASYSTRETIRQLENAQVPTMVLHQFTGVGDASSNLRALAFALFLDPEGERLVAELENQVAAARATLKPVLTKHKAQGSADGLRVLAYGSGSIYATGTTFNDLSERLGMTNIPAAEGQKGWPRASEEQLITWRPQVVFLGAADGSEERSAAFFKRDFPALFATEDAPKLVVLPGRDFTTVSQRLGALAQSIADRTRAALEDRSAMTPTP